MFGAGIAVLLVSTVRMLFPPGAALPQKAGGPARAASAAVSANAKRLWDAVVVLVALAILAVSLRYGGMPLMMVATIAVVVFQARRSWKE